MSKRSNRNQSENGFDRLDRRFGMLWSRTLGTILGLIGAVVFSRSVRAEDFSLSGYWPAFVLCAVLWTIAFFCWRSRESMLSMLSDVGVSEGKTDKPR